MLFLSVFSARDERSIIARLLLPSFLLCDNQTINFGSIIRAPLVFSQIVHTGKKYPTPLLVEKKIREIALRPSVRPFAAENCPITCRRLPPLGDVLQSLFTLLVFLLHALPGGGLRLLRILGTFAAKAGNP